jgi:formylglycine-generating enzyme required for sulfatase activity/CRP-like cAMP-binding protein
MRAAKKITVDRKLLQELVPLNALSPERFKEMSEKIVIEEVLAGRYLFRKGNRDNQSIYLLEGKVNLIDGFRKVTSEVEAGTDISRYPIANQQPRSLSARAVKKVVIASVDSSLLDVFLTWDQSSTAEVVDIGAESNTDWMTHILQSEAFIKIPPSMIQSLLIKMETLPVKAGDVVIRQGDSGDYFYTLHEGRCAVTRQDSPGDEEQLLAELHEGDSFGEDALVSDAKRNATVSMLTDGLLMRLAKKDFVELLKNQLVKRVDYEQAAAMVDDGAVWVDVRTEDEYEHDAFEDSVNIPLACLRDELSELVFNSKYIICCDTGRRSESAGFLLSHKGFDVYVLEGGIPGLSSSTVEPEVQMEVTLPSDDVAEVIDFEGGRRLSDRGPSADNSGVTDTQLDPESTNDVSTYQGADDAESALSDLRTENESLTRQLQSVRGTEERMSEQLELLRGELGESGEKLGGFYAKENEAASEKQLLQEQYHALQEGFSGRASGYEQVIEQLREQLGETQSHAATVRDEYQSVVDASAELTGANQTAEKEFEDRLQQQSILSDTLKDELDSLKHELGGVTKRLEEKSESMAALEAGNSALSEQNEALQAELETGNQQLAFRETAAEQQQQDFDGQLKALQETLDQQHEQVSVVSAEQVATAESMQTLQQENETLRTELRDSSVLQKEQKEQLENLLVDRQASDETVQRQQSDWDAERVALQGAIKSEQQAVVSLREELSLASAQSSEDKSAFEEELKTQLAKSNEKIERLELKQIEIKQKQSAKDDELETITSEREQLQQQLADSAEQNKQLESETASLKQQIESQASTSNEQLQQLQVQLEEAQEKTGSIEQLGGEKDAQIESLHEQLAQQGVEHEAGQQERELLQQQLKDMQLQLEQQEERSKLLEQENAESVKKAHEDITRKNDNERELQGQINRLRKKLEQQTTDHKKARDGAQDDTDNLREQLHAERQERADERAEMAARQRELKEQFSVIATEHESNLSNQSGAIEQARDAARQEEQERLREILASHSETEDQVIKLQQELKKAHEEISELAHEAKDRRQVDIELMEEQNQQAVATISQLESQLKQLVKDRDAALEDQQSLRDKMNTLRGEVEVTRGLMGVSGGVEDPAQLRKELDENKKNLGIAMRLRAEAEAARDQLLLERDALQKDVSEVPGAPLHVPSLDEGGAGSGHPGMQDRLQQAALPDTPLEREQDNKRQSLVDGKRDDKQRHWLGAAIGLGVVLVCALTGWLLTGGGIPVPGNDDSQRLTADAVPEAAPVLEATKELSTSEAQHLATPAKPDNKVKSTPVVTSQPDPEPVEEPQVQPRKEELVRVMQHVPVVAGRSFNDSLKIGGQGPVMVELPADSFEMGSAGNSLNFDEGPRHQVRLPAFSISKYEVTFTEYDKFARATGRRLPYDESWGRGDHPVINVSWSDARAYTRWLSEQTGSNYRLPSEAEWEYATRAGSETNFWWNDSSNNLHANCFNCGSEWDSTSTTTVGSFAANAFGLHDMTGNVQEWTEDCYHGSYHDAPVDGSARGAAGCTMRAVRGGAYTSPLDTLRNAKRSQYDQDTRLDNLGFRVVRMN